MIKITLVIALFSTVSATEPSQKRKSLSCTGQPHFNVTLTAYYPNYESDNEFDYLDARGKKLRTLQDYIDGRAEYVTVAMDERINIPYGSQICVPELNRHFGRRIPLLVRDRGLNLKGRGFSRLDICVRTEVDSYDRAVNRLVTVFVE